MISRTGLLSSYNDLPASYNWVTLNFAVEFLLSQNIWIFCCTRGGQAGFRYQLDRHWAWLGG